VRVMGRSIEDVRRMVGFGIDDHNDGAGEGKRGGVGRRRRGAARSAGGAITTELGPRQQHDNDMTCSGCT
jgi:hypothetical protein